MVTPASDCMSLWNTRGTDDLQRLEEKYKSIDVHALL